MTTKLSTANAYDMTQLIHDIVTYAIDSANEPRMANGEHGDLREAMAYMNKHDMSQRGASIRERLLLWGLHDVKVSSTALNHVRSVQAVAPRTNARADAAETLCELLDAAGDPISMALRAYVQQLEA